MNPPIHSPSLLRSIRRLTDPDDFHDAVSGVDLTVFFRKKQPFASQVEQYRSLSWALDFGVATTPTRTRGLIRNGWASLCFAMGPGSAIWNGQPAPVGTVSLLPPGKELDGTTVGRFHWLTAAISPDWWERCLSQAGATDNPPRQLTVCHLPELGHAAFSRELMEVRALLAHCPYRPPDNCPVMNRTGKLVMNLFTTACEIAQGSPPDSNSLRNRARIARLAEDHMLSCLAEPICVPDLCTSLHVSRRELEYAFRSVFDQSPRDHLETLRLHAIRRELQKADGRPLKIIDIAYAHGIHHLGRFAARYRDRFGEHPSETLRKSKG